MTGLAPFDPGGPVFVKKRSPFVGVTFQTGFLFESAQAHHGRRLVRIVTGFTTKDAFL
jgi:hypothetical protein